MKKKISFPIKMEFGDPLEGKYVAQLLERVTGNSIAYQKEVKREGPIGPRYYFTFHVTKVIE